MPGFIQHVNETTQCFHQAPATTAPVQARVLVGGQPAATVSSFHTVAGCPFTLPNGKPQPCVRIQWQSPATRVQILGSPALVQASPGTGLGQCLSAEQIPQGVPMISALQMRVRAI